MRNDDGGAAIEYAIIASAIAAVVVTVAFLVGDVVFDYFDRFYQLILLH